MPGSQENLEDFHKLVSGVPRLDTGRKRVGEPFSGAGDAALMGQEKLRGGDGGLTCLRSILSWPWMNCETQERLVRLALPSATTSAFLRGDPPS